MNPDEDDVYHRAYDCVCRFYTIGPPERMLSTGELVNETDSPFVVMTSAPWPVPVYPGERLTLSPGWWTIARCIARLQDERGGAAEAVAERTTGAGAEPDGTA